jgi:hypothetical protein
MSLLQGSKQLGAGDAAKPNADDTKLANADDRQRWPATSITRYCSEFVA